MILTRGYELTTSITNILISIVSVYSFLKVKTKNKLWKLFFFLMSINSFLGVVIHGIEMSVKLNTILWVILAIFFTITINTFLIIFLRYKAKHIAILSFLLSILMIVLIYYDLDFILAFTLYAAIVLIVSTYFIIKDNINNKKYYMLAILSQIIGGILMLSKITIFILNHNGIYHLFMVLTIFLLYLGTNKKNS